MTARQLPLPFVTQPHYAAMDFVPAASNEAARAWLARRADWPFGRLVLCGPQGAGKTHLLHIWCEVEGVDPWSGPALRGIPRLPQTGPIAVDDADLAEETALFHLINAAGEARRSLLLSAREPPARWHTCLPDLASRLRASATAMIGPAEDDLLRALFARLLAERQLAVPEAVQSWLLTRLPRLPASVQEAVARLDHAALAEGRAITRALAATILMEMTPEDGDDEILPSASPSAPALL